METISNFLSIKKVPIYPMTASSNQKNIVCIDTELHMNIEHLQQ
jgi:hypothetical protein